LRSSKVSRRKGGTISSRNPNNGYVHRKTAIAGKPAPTLNRIHNTIIPGEKKPADQAGLGFPANNAGLHVTTQQTFRPTFSQATFLQPIRTTLRQATLLQTIRTTFRHTTFQQTLRAAFSHTTLQQTLRAAFRHTTLQQTLRATFSHTIPLQPLSPTFSNQRMSKSIYSQYRKSKSKQDLAFHDDVLQVF
jgi:hypothetical protein